MSERIRNISYQQLAEIFRLKSSPCRNGFTIGLLLFAFFCAFVDILSEVLLKNNSSVQFIVETVSHGFTLLAILTLFFYLFNLPPQTNKLNDPLLTDSLNKGDLEKIFTNVDLNPLLSPKRLLPLMIISIFVAETAVMFLLDNIRTLPPTLEAIIDSTVLLLILSPTFFFLHYQPLKKHTQERLRIAQQLISSEERFHLALNAVKDSLWDYNPVTDSVYISPQSEMMLGYKPGEVGYTLDQWKNLLHPDDIVSFTEAFRSHMRGETENIHIESRLRSNSGRWIWVLTRGQAVSRDQQGAALRITGTLADITQRKKAELDLLLRKKQIRKLSHNLIHSAEAEKSRVAQDLHDEFGQVLTAFQLGLEVLRDQRDVSPDDQVRQCDKLLQMVQRLEIQLRGICDELTPAMLDDLGLADTMRWHIKEFVHRIEPFTVSQNISIPGKLSRETTIVAYRIFQEALHNISKHAYATKVDINLECEGTNIILTVKDNGHGFNVNDWQGLERDSWGFGLLGMRERATAIGGHVTIESEPGSGATVKASLPINSGRAL